MIIWARGSGKGCGLLIKYALNMKFIVKCRLRDYIRPCVFAVRGPIAARELRNINEASGDENHSSGVRG